MTSIIPPDPNAPFEEKLRFYRGLARISPEVVSGPELRAMARAWLKEHGQSHHFSPGRKSKSDQGQPDLFEVSKEKPAK